MNWDRVFTIQNQTEFNKICLDTFHFQMEHVSIYKKYVQYLNIKINTIDHYTKIPFLPIELFKTQEIIAHDLQPEIIFTSSGTTGMTTSKHLVAEKKVYEQSFRTAFEQFYGKMENIAILALLPSYLERTGSSLIYMINDLMEHSQQPESNYFLYNHEELYQTLLQLKTKGTKTLLFGVTFALLDFIEKYELSFPELIIMETGGMKGKRKEMVREEIHDLLCKSFQVSGIHSEYGMTELLSQGYSYGNGIFKHPNWMKILIRETNDPLTLATNKKTGAINVIDLANRYSCSFIATQDLGKIYDDGSFEVLGRFDQSDIRGCNLLVQ
ncbi:acyltransferase [Sphingobacterium faecium NBRC 15299]|uniref:LuxE/PaaK family acyltransferase n=1 Tax=Sphingobacterium faecium TaxID=34087 RepID=UPI000D3A578B|nr:acyl transferase [Sphingobacterium faecium]PTX13838.1 acyl-protein synthetase LuxE [Sphingobacterium faecium]GEM64836.1 acyltransferase [Sphingobacterium faecium NBRC 15299]